MDPKEIKKNLKKVEIILYNLFALILIVTLFLLLSLFHAELGGFKTVNGTFVGVLTILLFFSPIIDWVIKWLFRIKEKTWFQVLLQTIGITKLALSISACIGITLFFLLNRSWSTLFKVLKSIFDVIIN